MRGLAWFAALALAVPAMACGGAAQTAPEPQAPEAEAPKPRNAAAIAQAIAGGKVSVLVYAERTRGHPIAARIAALDAWKPVLEGTGIDPTRDLTRAFVTAPKVAAEREAVAVLEHTLPPDKLAVGMDTLLSRSEPPGIRLEGLGVPAVQVTIRGHTRVVAQIEPSFLVVLPEAKAKMASRFVGTGGFPDPVGEEAAVATALEPSRTLKAPHAPPVPRSLASLTATVTLAADGGADIALDGQDQSPEQATEDAGELTQAIDRATSVQISVVKLRLFDPVEFFAEGDRVKAKRHVTPGEIDKLFGLLSAVLPR